MRAVKRSMILILAFVVLASAGYFIFSNWSWVFADKYEGQILAVEKAGQSQAIIVGGSNASTDAALFSYSVKLLTKDKNGKEKVITGSSEDRQWAVAVPGECVRARFEPYVPWDLKSAGTYHNVRLLEFIRPCGPEYAPLHPPAPPAPEAAAPVAPPPVATAIPTPAATPVGTPSPPPTPAAKGSAKSVKRK